MFKKAILGLAGVTLVLSVANAVPLFDGELSVGVMQQKPDGWLNYRGSTVDLRDTLGFDDKTKFFAKAKIEHPIPFLPNLYLQYTPMDFDGDRITAFTFDRKTYVGRVHTELQLDHYDIGFYYNLPMVSTMTSGVFDAEVGLFIRVIDFQAKVSDGVRTSTADFTAPIPMLYGSLTINPIEFVSIVAEGKGITYNDNYYYDFSGEVRLTPFSAVVMKPFISFGYKIERLRIDDIDDVYSDIRIKQPYVAMGISF